MNNKQELTSHLKNMWYDICILERDFGVEYDGYMTNILKFTIQCIANKYKINLGLQKEK